MASGNGRPSNPAADDPSIIGISNSHGNSGRPNNQRNHPSSHPGAARQRPQASQQPRRQYHQQQQQHTPTSSEKQRQEHWKVPTGNSRQSPLAKDLFGAENNAQFRFDFQNYDHHQGNRSHHDHRYGSGYQQPGGRHGGRSNQNYGKHNKGPPNQEGQGSSQASKFTHRQHNGGTPQPEQGSRNTQNSTPKPKPSAPTQIETERQVQYFETLMRNGEKASNLTITVPGKTNEKKGGQKESKLPEKGSKSPTKSMLEDVRSSANKFSNPLMQPKPVDTSTSNATHPKQNIPKETEKPVDQPRNESKETQPVEQQEKKKKRRNRERKRKKDKNTADEKQKRQETSAQPMQILERTGEKSSSKENQKSVQDKQTTSTSKDEKDFNVNTPKNTNKSEPRPEQAGSKEDKKSDEQEERDAATKKLEEQLGLEQAEKRLEKDMIFRLEKKSTSFPEAIYFCKLCSHHLNTISHAHKHIKDKRHKRETKAREQDQLLQKLKLPPPGALAALDRHLEAVIKREMMSQDDAAERKKVVDRLNEVVSHELPGCRVIWYGSSVTTVGLKSSDINIDIQYRGEMRTPAVLMKLLDVLKNSDKFTEVHEDFDAKVPRIEIKDRQTDIRCLLSLGNVKSVHTTRLLRIYGKIEPATIKLSMLYRLWGHLCQVDRQQDGSLPPHSFILMTIFYLQQKHGLPALHEVMADHDIENLLSDSNEEQDVLRIVDGEWWYYPTAPPADAKDSNKEETEDDVDEPAEFSESDDDIVITFSESPTKEAPPQLDGDVTKSKEKPLVPVKLEKCFSNEKTPNLAELWLGLLKFYAAQFDIENLVISIRSSSRVTRADRGWSHRRIAVEDPCSPKWNLCKPMNSQALFNYFLTRLKHSVFYFHTTHNSVKNKQQKEPMKKDPKSSKTAENHKIETPQEIAKDVMDSILESVCQMLTNDSPQSPQQLHPNDNASTAGNDVNGAVSSLADTVVDDVIDELKTLDVGKKDQTEGSKQQKDEENYDSCYKFTKSSLTDGKVPVVVCSVCKKEGHRKKNCPDEVKIKVEPLPKFTDRLRIMLDRVCRDIYDMYVPQEDEVRMREKVCSDLLDYLQRNYDENVQLCLFGSSRNRFTFRGSDLDVCMTLHGNDTGEDLDYTEVIEGLAKVLRKDSNLRQIIPITTAKVPIVKFYHPKANLEGDISLYNLLAQRNTSMVALYATIDERCRMLGYAMKAFVKRCYIGDASRGSLSSYAYILLVIYFLQQRTPPVLPVLQELYKGEKMPEHFVDGWNSWFYENIGNLDKVWPDFRKNHESLGELWIGMLRFYTEKFDFSRHVVSIRQKRLLTAFEKEWTSKCICIEDPFDLNHNLGAGVSRKMTNFILKVFVKARERFGTEPPNELNGFLNFQNSASEYFFNAEFLMDGQEVPNDRCCRICGKIGHFVKDCPKRRSRGKKGDDGKLRDVECFACGKKGHFKKDCPEPKQARGSPVKETQFLQHHPLQQMRLIMPQTHPMMIPPLMHNIGQASPVIVQAKTQVQMRPRFTDPQHHQKPVSQPPQKPQENPSKRHQNQTPGDRGPTPGRQNSQTQAKTPQSGNRRQTNSQGGNSPHPVAGGKSPFPSSGPNVHPPSNGRGGQNQRPSVNRNLSSDFESDQQPRQRMTDNPMAPRPSHSDPVRHHAPPNTRSGTKHQSLGESPSPGAIYTVTEIESQMMERAKEHMRPGDNLNHLIPRQGGKEEMHPNPGPRYPTYSQGYPSSPLYPPPFGMSPLSPQTPPMYPPPYMAQFSTSPQSRGNPFSFHQEYQRNEGLSRTPPSPMAYNIRGFSPPRPGYGYPQQPVNQQRPNIVIPDTQGEPISGRTFVNSNQGGPSRREIHFAAPSSAPPYHSYPPDHQHFGPNPHGQHPQHWSGPNTRK